MSKPYDESQTAPEEKRSSSQAWVTLACGVRTAIVLIVVGPRVVAELRAGRSGETAEERQAAEKSQGETPRAAAASEAGAWRPLSGGRRGGVSASDVMACNRAAQAARRNSSQELPSDLASAMEAGNGTLVGATADSLKRVNMRARNDARAAEAYQACVFERTF